jgi:acyl-CoA thioesterase YciA
MTFLKPVHVGDVVSCHVELKKTGNTSLTINVEVWALPTITQVEKYQVTEGLFVFVAIDEFGKPRKVPVAHE